MRERKHEVRHGFKRQLRDYSPTEQAKGGGMLRLMAAALVVVILGVAGSASAAALIGSRQIKDGSLKGVDIAGSTIRGSDVRDLSLQLQDFSVKPKGVTGDQGDTGDDGVPGSPDVTYVDFSLLVGPNFTGTKEVPCSAQKAIFGEAGLPPQMDLLQSAPEADGSGWDFVIRNSRAVAQTATLQVICVTDR